MLIKEEYIGKILKIVDTSGKEYIGKAVELDYPRDSFSGEMEIGINNGEHSIIMFRETNIKSIRYDK